MTPKEAHNKLWQFVYTARVNQLYYERIGMIARTIHMLLRFFSVGTAIVGGVLGLLSLFVPLSHIVNAVSISVGLVAMAVAIVFDILAVDSWIGYSADLRSRWTQLKSLCEQYKTQLEPKSADKLSNKNLERVNEAIKFKNDTDDAEKRRPFMFIHRRCQWYVNRQTYDVEKGTYGEVKKKLGLA